MTMQRYRAINNGKASRMSRHQRAKQTLLTPRDYLARDTVRVAKFLIAGKKYAEATTNAIDRVQRFWDR